MRLLRTLNANILPPGPLGIRLLPLILETLDYIRTKD